MCGRYYIDSEEDQQEIREILTELNRRYRDRPVLNQLATGEIFPTQYTPVLVNDNDLQEIRPAIMSWGFPLPGSSRQSVINARSETVETKPMFRRSVEHGRLIIPANAYFEWEQKQDGSKIKQRIAPADGSMLQMAGLWRVFTHSDGSRLISFVIITRPASAELAFIHDRMPLVLDRNSAASWLSDKTEAVQFLHEPPEQIMKVTAVI